MKSQQTDHELVLRLKAGDHAAVETLMGRHGNAVFGYCMRMLSDRAAAEDIAQDVWIKVIRYASNYQEEGHFRAWLMTITRNTMLTQIRKRLPAQSYVNEEGEEREYADDFDLEGSFVENQDLARLKKAIEGLPEPQRVVLTLWLEDGAAYEEIAKELGVTEGVVRANLYRAKQTLRRRLEQK